MLLGRGVDSWLAGFLAVGLVASGSESMLVPEFISTGAGAADYGHDHDHDHDHGYVSILQLLLGLTVLKIFHSVRCFSIGAAILTDNSMVGTVVVVNLCKA